MSDFTQCSLILRIHNSHFICINALSFRISTSLGYFFLVYFLCSCPLGNLVDEEMKEQQWERENPLNLRAVILCWFKTSIFL